MRGYAVPQGPQAFSLAYEISPPALTWLSPSGFNNLVPGTSTVLHWQWSGPSTTARLEYRLVGNSQWRVVSTAVNLTANRMPWTIPDTITLAQTKSITNFPLVLYGKEYYQPLMNVIDTMIDKGTISESDKKLVLLTDDIDEAMQYIQAYIAHNFKVKPRRKLWWLLERR